MNKHYEDWKVYQEYVSRGVMQVAFLDNYAGPEEFKPATKGDAGIDLYCAHGAGISLYPGETAVVPCGIKLILPRGHEGQIRPKSGRAAKENLTVLNTPGTIDEGYRGEIQVILHNATGLSHYTLSSWANEVDRLYTNSHQPTIGEAIRLFSSSIMQEVIYIQPGQKIAQLVVARYARPEIQTLTPEEYENYSPSERGTGGFGSTGI